MKPSGIHLLLTYKCNASCDHCFLSCGPERNGLISLEEARKYLDDADAAPYIDHFFIEGGEPFLYPELLTRMVAEISSRGFWLGVITNGFWAGSDERARELLAPLVAAGLGSLGVSTGAWHNRFVPVERAERAVRIAGELGLSADLMVCTGGPQDRTIRKRLKDDGYDFYASGLICRGRAATNDECRIYKHKWQKLKVCPDSFGGRSRVHLGPGGQIHLCQGLLLGRDARLEPLSEIFAGFKVEEHPLCAALSAGGPAGLARLAMESGFAPESGYADGCQLCFEARRHLLPYFPQLIGPAEMYADPAARLKRTRRRTWQFQIIAKSSWRKSGFTLIGKLTRKTARQVREAATGLLGPISNLVHTITLDNGKEFAFHEDIARSLNARIYFAHPTPPGNEV